MRVSICYISFVLLLLISVNASLSGQDVRVSLHYDNTVLRKILKDFESQTNLSFSYSNRLFDDKEKMSVHLDDITVDSALKVIFIDKGINYLLLEKQIVLKKKIEFETLKQEERVKNTDEERKYTISGHVRDAASGELLIGATIAVEDGSAGAISNSYGFYSLTLSRRFDSLVCTYIGYGQQSHAIRQNTQNLDFSLSEHHQSINEVVIYANETIDVIRTTRSSEQNVRPESVRKMPALFGEKDVIKSLAAIPGIKFFGDGSTIFYVRGGSRDQNLVTIDEAPVYNPSHILGFFSTVVPDAVKNITVYKGDFPASYGGRLSSLVDIRTKDGNMRQFGMDASLGLLSSRLSIEGPIWKEHISYFISGRRSYILKPLQLAFDNLEDLHFSDFHFKLNYRMNEKNRFFLSIYNSVDNFESTQGLESFMGISWKNTTSTLRWNHIFGEKIFLNTTLYASSYDYYLNTDLRARNYWKSHIDNFSLKSDFTYYISSENTLRFGAKIAQHFMNPGNYYLSDQIIPLSYPISTKSSNEIALYATDQMILSENWSLRVGLRLTTWNSIGPAVEYTYEDKTLRTHEFNDGFIYNTHATADPRISVVYRNGDASLFKFSYSRTSQFEHLITNSISPFSTLEVWLPSGPFIKPGRANQLTFGQEYRFGELKWSGEFYAKRMSNQIDYRDHAKLLMNPFLEAQLLFGEGRAYGFETMLAKERGKLNGWISYTISHSELQIEGINSGNPYPSYGDRPHDFSIFLSYKINPRLELSGSFNYMTGSPFTSPTAFYYHENIEVPIYFKRNNDRLPPYHRMDAALNWNLRKKEDMRFKHELIFSVYNLYGRKNPVAIHFNKVETPEGSLVTPYNFYQAPQLVPTQFYLFQMVPSVSYHFSF